MKIRKVNGIPSIHPGTRRRTTENMNAEQELKESKGSDRIGNLVEDDKEPSPFKIYEDKYCSRCQDYRGCIGLIDSLAVKMQDQDIMKGLPEEMAGFLRHFVESTGMGSGQRFGMITTCMGARNYMAHHDKKSKGKKHKKKATSEVYYG